MASVFEVANHIYVARNCFASGVDSTEKLEAAALEAVGGEHVSLGI